MNKIATSEGPIADLVRKYGGVEKLAKECHVSSRCIHHWATGKRNPGGPSKEILRQLEERVL